MESLRPDLTRVFATFGRSLRSAGLRIGTDQIARYASAVSRLDATDVLDLFWAGRCCLVSRVDDIEVYDTEFARFFLGDGLDPIEAIPDTGSERAEVSDPHPHGEDPVGFDEQGGFDGEVEDVSEGGEEIGHEASSLEVLQTRSLTDLTDDEMAELDRMLAGLHAVFPKRRVLRTAAGGRGGRIDLRRTVRRSLRLEGELLERIWRRRLFRTRPVLILIDISGSMSAYSRALLHFAYAIGSTGIPTETFCFGTRLTRVTPWLGERDPDLAVAGATGAIGDWSGGTRIGESLRELFKVWGDRPVIRGSVVLLFSDGLERGDPQVLEAQMGRLSRMAHRVVWLNPLKGDSGYMPLARGMRAALPHVDRLVAAESAGDLLDLGRIVAELVGPAAPTPAR